MGNFVGLIQLAFPPITNCLDSATFPIKKAKNYGKNRKNSLRGYR